MQIKIVIGTIAFMIAMMVFGFAALREQSRMVRFTNAELGRSIEAGSEIFANNCATCHGGDGTAQECFDTNGNQIACQGLPLNYNGLVCGDVSQRMMDMGWKGTKHDYVLTTVSAGRGTVMPTWSELFGGPLRPDQVENVTNFVLNFESEELCAQPLVTYEWPELAAEFLAGPDVTPPGDPARGEELYTTTYGCVACHGSLDGSTPAAVGPSLADIETAGGAVSGVRLAGGGTISCGTVVMAAGPWCVPFLERAGLGGRWPLEPTRIQIVHIDRPAELPGELPACVDMAGGIYFRPQNRGQQIIVGSVREEDEREAVGEPDDYARYVDDDFVRPVLHALQHRLRIGDIRGPVRGYSGLYTINRADMHPVVGATPVPGLHVANGCSGHGFKLAPAIGANYRLAYHGEPYGFTPELVEKFDAKRTVEMAIETYQKIRKHGSKVWLVNTGWTGGPFGVGSRMKLSHTRAIVDAIHEGALDGVATDEDPIFGLAIPKSCPNVPTDVLVPRNTWADKSRYDETARKLAFLFKENFKKYEAGASDAVRGAGPRI